MTHPTLYSPQRERVLSIWTGEAEREELVLLGKIDVYGAWRPNRSEVQAMSRLEQKAEVFPVHPGYYAFTTAGYKRVREWTKT